MTYATEQDLIDRYTAAEILQLSDHDDNDANDPDVIADALADADREINKWIGGRYNLPLVTVPENLQHEACKIARYFLHRDGAPEKVEKEYDGAIAYLKMVAQGKIDLPPSVAGDNAATGGQAHGTKDDDDRIFTMDSLEGF